MWFAAAFALFVLYGMFALRRGPAMAAQFGKMSRKRRAALGSLILLCSALLLLAGFVAAFSTIRRDGSAPIWTAPLLIVLSLGFIHLQVTAAAIVMSVVAVTNKPGVASSIRKDR